MKKKTIVILLVIICIPNVVQAQRGCCSHHGGVAGCSSSGRQICRDGTLSPTCTCSGSGSKNTKSIVYGCTDKNAYNYNAKATKDNGSCIAKKYGCMDKSAINYDKNANTSNNTCQYEKQEKEVESISYDIEYKDGEKKDNAQEIVLQKGKNGKKEIIYKTIVDQSGKIISKEKVRESIVEEPLKEIIETNTIPLESFSTIVDYDISKKEESNNSFLGIWIISLILSFIYYFLHKNGNLLLNKIAKQKKYKVILYCLYVVLIIPVFIDVIIIIKNILMKSFTSITFK